MTDPFMTVSEAIIWIATRDQDLASEHRDVRPQGVAALFSIRHIIHGLARANVSNTQDLLTAVCVSGEVTANGYRGNRAERIGNNREALTTLNWTDLRIMWNDNSFIAGPKRNSFDGPYWHDLRFAREDVLKAFSASRSQAESSPVSEMLEPVAAATKPKRRRGAVSFATDDKPLVDEMHELITSGKARSINAAAGMVVSRAVGFGDEESKLKRLRDRYSKAYPD
jgi:hypothetical protein